MYIKMSKKEQKRGLLTSLQEFIGEDEVYLIVRRNTKTNDITLESNVSPDDAGEVLFRPLIASGTGDTFDYGVSILRSLVEVLEQMSGMYHTINKSPNTYRGN